MITGSSAKNASAYKSSNNTHKPEQATSTSMDPSKKGCNTADKFSKRTNSKWENIKEPSDFSGIQ